MKTDPVEYALKIQAAKAQKERDDKMDAALNSDKSMVDVVKDIEEVSLFLFSMFPKALRSYSKYNLNHLLISPLHLFT